MKCRCYQRWRTNILCLGSSRKRINKPSQSFVLESHHPYIRVLVHNQNWGKKLECLQNVLAQLSLTFAMIMHILMSMKNEMSIIADLFLDSHMQKHTVVQCMYPCLQSCLNLCLSCKYTWFITFICMVQNLNQNKLDSWVFCLNPANKLLKESDICPLLFLHHIFYISCHFVPWNHSQPFFLHFNRHLPLPELTDGALIWSKLS